MLSFFSFLKPVNELTIVDQSEYLSNNFQKDIYFKYLLSAKFLTKHIFPIFSDNQLIKVYKIIIHSFDEKNVWFYVGNKKQDLSQAHLNFLSNELICYLRYLEKNGIAKRWLKSEKTKTYYKLILTAFCYQIRRIAVSLFEQEKDIETIKKIQSDSLFKAAQLAKRLQSGSDFFQQANDILKNYECLISSLFSKYNKF
jgi:hypothetical protein